MKNIKLEEGDLVLCTVDRIIGTVVFVKIEGLPEDREGSILTSEVAPGRIRNLRDYVIPNKKIVCKILRIAQNGNIELSLRRVTQKETKEVLEIHNQEKTYKNILKSILKENYNKAILEIEKNWNFYDFINSAKENPKDIEKIIGKESTKKLIDILNSQKSKNTISKKEINLSTTLPNGLEIIKSILTNIKDSKINYIAAGRYSIIVEDSNPKIAGNKLKQALNDIEEQARKYKIEFSIK